MADENQTEASHPPGMQLLVDERDLRTHYSNAYRIHATADEVIVDLGFNMPDPNPRQPGAQPTLLYKINERLIMSYSNAKRLAQSLGTLIKRYEQQFGELPTSGPRQPPR